MTAPLSARLMEGIRSAGGLYHRLVLAVGPARSGKTRALGELAAERGWPRINVNLQLSERMLELTGKQRAVHAAALLGEIVDAGGSDVVLLDNIELLFATELHQDPLRLLEALSRNRTIVAAWPGAFDGRSLTYADAAHPERRSYSTPDAVIVAAAAEAPVAGPEAPQEIP